MDVASLVQGLGALGGAGANALGSLMSYQQTKKLMRHQANINYEFAEKSARNQPTWNRAGLESAGYNPMLAVQNATSGANSHWTAGGQGDMPNLAEGMSSGLANAQSFQRLENETRTAISQQSSNFATARNQIAEAINKETENPYISQRLEAEIGKTSAETAKLNSDTEVNKATIENMESRLELDRYLGELGIYSNLSGVKYSSDKAYNASTYHSNKLQEIADSHSPSGRSASFENYMRGVGHIGNAIGSVLRGTTIDNSGYDETNTYTYDKNGNITGRKETKRKHGNVSHSRKHR